MKPNPNSVRSGARTANPATQTPVRPLGLRQRATGSQQRRLRALVTARCPGALHNARCLGSPSFEGSPRTWTSSVARVHRIELPAIAITIASLAAHDAGHRPPNFDVLIIAP
jgi:hypothetical protein